MQVTDNLVLNGSFIKICQHMRVKTRTYILLAIKEKIAGHVLIMMKLALKHNDCFKKLQLGAVPEMTV